MVKKEAHDKALDMFLKSKGQATIKAIADAAGVIPLTITRWQKKENWRGKLEEVRVAPAVKKRKPRGGTIIKKAVFEEAIRIFQQSGGTISNVKLSKAVKTSPATIAKWKNMPGWNQAESVPATSEPLKAEYSPKPPETAQVSQESRRPEVMALSVEAIVAPQDLVALNDRLRSMLNREYLTTEDLENLSNAKLTLLEAASMYLGILKDAE